MSDCRPESIMKSWAPQLEQLQFVDVVNPLAGKKIPS